MSGRAGAESSLCAEGSASLSDQQAGRPSGSWGRLRASGRQPRTRADRPPSDMFVSLVRVLGANSTPLSYGEIFSALQTKLICSCVYHSGDGCSISQAQLGEFRRRLHQCSPNGWPDRLRDRCGRLVRLAVGLSAGSRRCVAGPDEHLLLLLMILLVLGTFMDLAPLIIGVLRGSERPRRLEPLRAARFEALRTGRSVAMIESCAAVRSVLVL